MRNWKQIILLGIFGGIANNGLMWLSFYFPKGLYMDTMFTVAAAFIGGLIPGLISAVLTTVIYGIIYNFIMGMSYFWAWYFYILCSVIAVLLVCLFVCMFQVPTGGRAYQLGRLFIMLTTLSLAVCILVSITGGLISTCISMLSNVVPKDNPPETLFRLGLIRQGFSLLASEILGRIPVNLADKPIAVFGGYGISLLIRRALKARKAAPAAP